ncbi:MAG: rhomboid family intramembrane serine protease [Deinococcota bacterium]
MRKLDYNAPVILTFAILAVGIFIVGQLIPAFIGRYFLVRGSMSLLNPLDYFRLISHVLGHGSWQHLFGNLTLVLLLGPILEEKYGSIPLLIMIVVTALVTGIINIVFFSSGLLGASGIVFMLIILVSIVDLEAGSIPLTFVLVVVIFLGGEFVDIFRNDNISQMSHIIGGAVGAFFGFVIPHDTANQAVVTSYR